VVSYHTSGGGGYGLSEERDQQLVLRDVRDGKVSPTWARKVYKVVINTNNWNIDLKATDKLRSEKEA
jgi:N-methylhydantoinase B